MAKPNIQRETWDSVYEKSIKLAKKIEADCRHNGWRFDVLVIVPRGAYYPGNIIAHELSFSAIDILHASIVSYEDDKQLPQFRLGQMPTAEQVKGKNLLIIDEVCDTGQTLNFLTDYLRKNGASLVKTGVVHYKPSQSQTNFKPDWSVAITNNWIIYPWESHDEAGMASAAGSKS